MKNDNGRGGYRRDNRFGRDENQPRSFERKYDGRNSAKKPYGNRENRAFEERKSYGDEKNNTFGERKPYGGNRSEHYTGAVRRTYAPEGMASKATLGPRVGRIADNVPRAMRISGDKPPRPPRGEFMEERNFKTKSHKARVPYSTFRNNPELEYEPPEIPEDLMEAFSDVPFEDENLLVGRNPIREALKAGRPVEKLLVASGDLSGAAKDIVKMAKDANVIVQYVDRGRLDQIYPAHQGMLAYVAAVPYVPVEEILARAAEKGEDPFLILLDGITDPHNLGAIIRSAECAGAHGVILPERRAAGLGPAAAKAAAGALNHMPIARVKNINRTIEDLQKRNIWVIGTAMDGENAFTADLTGPVALVIGSEGDGISRLTLEKCDRKLTLPMKGSIESLNASVAAGILMYAIARARTM